MKFDVSIEDGIIFDISEGEFWGLILFLILLGSFVLALVRTIK